MTQWFPKQERCPSWDTFDPLGPSADPRRYVALDSFERALASLARAIGDGLSPLLLDGVGGCGKTMLLRVLAERERWSAQRVVFSPFLHLPPGDVARWLLHLLGQSFPADSPADDALLEDVRARDGRRTVVLIDEIQCTPDASVSRLAALADAGRPHLVVLAAGTSGPKLDAIASTLRGELRVSLPPRLPPGEMSTLCDAILSDPALPEALQVLSPASREAILRDADGVPGLLTAELVRRAYEAGAYADRRAVHAAPARGARAQAAQLEIPNASAGAACRAAPSPAVARSLRSYVAVDPEPPCGVDEIDLPRWVARHEDPPPAQAGTWRRRVLPSARRIPARAARRCRDASRRAKAAVAAGAATLVAAAAADLRAQAAALVAIALEIASVLRRTASALERGARALAGAAAAGLAARAAAVASAARSAWGATERAVSTRVTRTASATLSALRATRPRLPGALPAMLAAGALLALGLLAPPAAERNVPPRADTPPPPAASATSGPVVIASAAGSRAPGASAPPSVRVQVNARPWARIRVDGVDVGPTPLSHVRLQPGPHAFEADFPDGRRVLRVVDIGAEHRFVSLP